MFLTVVTALCVSRQEPIQMSCGVSVTSACRGVNDTDVTLHYTSEAVAGDGCVQCNLPHCNTSIPSTGLSCKPFLKECAMCGDPEMSMIGPGYTVVVRPQCAAIAPCAGNVSISGPIVLTNIGSISISAAPYYADHPIIVTTCPLFHFIGSASVTIANLTIRCIGASDAEMAPAILFEKAYNLALHLSDITVTGAVRSAILVLGGNFDVVPPITSTTLSGSASKITVQTSEYIDAQALTLTDYTGTIDVEGLANFSRVTINPDAGGTLTLGSNNRIGVTNVAELTNIYGRTYETEFDSGTDTYALPASETKSIAKTLIVWLLLFLLFQIALGIVLYQDIYARYRAKRAAALHAH